MASQCVVAGLADRARLRNMDNEQTAVMNDVWCTRWWRARELHKQQGNSVMCYRLPAKHTTTDVQHKES